MRLLSTLKDQKQARLLSAYLARNGIDNHLEEVPNTDWGSADYGTLSSKLWVIDEDLFERSQTIAEEFLQNPDDPRYSEGTKPKTSTIFAQQRIKAPLQPPRPPISTREKMGPITFNIILLCSLLLLFSIFSIPEEEKAPPANLPYTPFYMPPIYKDLMFDYPLAFEILDKIINAYGADSLQDIEKLPPEGKLLLQKFYQTPYWRGFYDNYMYSHLHPGKEFPPAPMFEKIRQGEAYRLFTPCLLHAGLLHLLFNMLWLAILGRQMEQRLGKGRYILFMLIAGIFSNIAQYLMGGSSFLGYSGILCGMLAFVWVRRRQAAWEGYQLQPGTLGFIAFFILLMFGIQIISFFTEYYTGHPLSPGIANTAHLTGAFIGYLMGKLKFFAWKIS